MQNIYLGSTKLAHASAEISGSFTQIEGEMFYKIQNYNRMPDFFMTIVSDSDHWMYLSSNGSLSAGRRNRNNALFPYYTEDKIHDYCGKTGSKTIVLVEVDSKKYLWEPFSKELENVYSIERNIYKSIYGNKIIFEEINQELKISFKYGWYNSEKFGWIKRTSVLNLDSKPMNISIVDGLQNLLPNGVDYFFQNEYSNLSDAYKKNELIPKTQLGIFSLSSIPVDKAEPSESLNSTTVWSVGLENPAILLSDRQLNNFRNGITPETEIDIRAARCAYFVHSQLLLLPNAPAEWTMVAELNQDSTKVANLNMLLQSNKSILEDVIADIKAGTENLIKIVASADGLQTTNEKLTTARHFSNTMFNVMRGGIYTNNYKIQTADFKKFVATCNKKLSTQIQSTLNSLELEVEISDLIDIAENSGNNNFTRICYEYLPLTFSRRHGDPSRPWNQFSIEIKNDDGTPKSDFQGNWRDIFQNWEALSLSYPEFVENIISKFLNATTADGYNPYRIMRNGIDWEAPHPNDPWAYIGYWGDHQIIYLQKLLELSENYHPEKLDELLTKQIFAYANVPYRIKNYSQIVADPQNTIDFDFDLHHKIENLVTEMGADGRLMLNNQQNPIHTNLTEKILVTLLSKLSNFVPEAGIWLNTQRPEWNDANNALVGSGVSMVTLYYIRRFLKFWNNKFNSCDITKVDISKEVKTLFDSVFNLFAENVSILNNGFTNEQRRYFTDVLGFAGENYRNTIYQNSFSGEKSELTISQLQQFTEIALRYIDQSIEKNKRADGLYHAYNLISFADNSISIRYLYEMLEGQVAVLSSGYLSVNQSLEVMDALKASSLFRADQYSYILYPNRNLPRFNQKNNIPTEQVNASPLLQKLIENNNTSILKADVARNYHFNGSFRNAKVLESALNKLPESYQSLVNQEKETILAVYESMFDHQSFTGRSGTFFGYEGLGSIYWHMVSKLLLTVEEVYIDAINNHSHHEIIGRLKQHYYEIKAGVGVYKSPQLYGAFPTDAYSHTPEHSGAKQPGMTGQVKEDVISRMGELGVRVRNGEISFELELINENEFTTQLTTFNYIDLNGERKQIELKTKQLAFTICQVPVLYTCAIPQDILITFTDGRRQAAGRPTIPKNISQSIFKRTHKVAFIEVR